MELLGMMGFMLLAAVAYLLPIVIVTYRRHPHSTAITVLVLTFGWSGVGWLVALVWALLPVRRGIGVSEERGMGASGKR